MAFSLPSVFTFQNGMIFCRIELWYDRNQCTASFFLSNGSVKTRINRLRGKNTTMKHAQITQKMNVLIMSMENFFTNQVTGFTKILKGILKAIGLIRHNSEVKRN